MIFKWFPDCSEAMGFEPVARHLIPISSAIVTRILGMPHAQWFVRFSHKLVHGYVQECMIKFLRIQVFWAATRQKFMRTPSQAKHHHALSRLQESLD